MASPTPEQWTAISKLVNSFFSKADAEPFREPVDWQGLGLFDYPQVIKAPMDLGTIKKRLSDKKYSTVFQVADDVRLVWTNCMTYNADGSDFFVLAQNLKKEWERRFSKLLQDHSISAAAAAAAASAPSAAHTGAGGAGQADAAGGASSVAGGAGAAATTNFAGADATKVTLEEKRSFARSLYKISKEDLGKLLVEVDNKCQVALTRNSAEDEYELNVDKIPPVIFLDLVNFVKQCSNNSNNGDKKSATSGPGGSGGAGASSGGGAGGGSSKKKITTATGNTSKRQKS